jgi:hypothetical protein
MVSGEEIDEAVDWLKSQGDSVSADILLALKARAEAAEKERDMLKAALERRGEIVFGKEGD